MPGADERDLRHLAEELGHLAETRDERMRREAEEAVLAGELHKLEVRVERALREAGAGAVRDAEAAGEAMSESLDGHDGGADDGGEGRLHHHVWHIADPAYHFVVGTHVGAKHNHGDRTHTHKHTANTDTAVYADSVADAGAGRDNDDEDRNVEHELGDDEHLDIRCPNCHVYLGRAND